MTETAAIVQRGSGPAASRARWPRSGCEFVARRLRRRVRLLLLPQAPRVRPAQDRRRVRHATCPPASPTSCVVKSVVDIARGLGKRTIAEFVEDEETLELLRGMGVDFAQGYYVAKPAPLPAGRVAAPTSRHASAARTRAARRPGSRAAWRPACSVSHAALDGVGERVRDQLRRRCPGRGPPGRTATIWTSLLRLVVDDRAGSRRARRRRRSRRRRATAPSGSRVRARENRVAAERVGAVVDRADVGERRPRRSSR